MLPAAGLLRAVLTLACLGLLAGCGRNDPPFDVDQAVIRQQPATGTSATVPLSAPAQADDRLPRAPDERAALALAGFLESRASSETPRHRDAHVDLDGDGRKDVLMLLDDPYWCDPAGCTLLVFQAGEEAFRLVGEVRPAQAPVAVGDPRHHGWHDLLVGVGGAGTQAGTVTLQFNGSGYPDNPTLLALLSAQAMPEVVAAID